MKVFRTVLLALLASLQRIEASEEEYYDRHLKVTMNAIAEFNAKNKLKPNAKPKLQYVLSDGYVNMGENDIPLNDENLEKVDVYAPGATVVVDDGQATTPTSTVYRSKKDLNTLVSFDANGDLSSAVHTDPDTLETTSTVRLAGHIYATVNSADEEDHEYVMEEDSAPGHGGESRNLRGIANHNLPEIRVLEQGCTDYDVMEVVIVVDSSLTSSVGGSSAAQTLVNQVIAETNKFYEVSGLCKTLKVAKTQIYTNNDPIRDMLSSAPSCSGSGGLLADFRNFVAGRSDLQAHATHLFYDGNAGPGNFDKVIGCAYKSTLCYSSGGYSTGVNNMGFSSDLGFRAKLLGHEHAHICAASHSTLVSDIMYPSLCTGFCSGKNIQFGDSSKASINNGVSAASCTSKGNGSGVGGSSSPTCQDDGSRITVYGENACNWLKRQSPWISSYCNAYQLLRDNCRQTCSSCS